MTQRELLERFLAHLHETAALSATPSETWIDAFLSS